MTVDDLINLPLARAIRTAAAATLDEVYRSYPDHEFFAFAISTYPFLDSLSLSANSNQNFSEVFSGLPPKYQKVESKNFYKWSPEEWGKFEAINCDSEYWGEAISILHTELADPLQRIAENAAALMQERCGAIPSDADEYEFNKAYLLACINAALHQLDLEGAFSKSNARDSVVIFASVAGEFGPERLESIRLLNSTTLSEELLAEIELTFGEEAL